MGRKGEEMEETWQTSLCSCSLKEQLPVLESNSGEGSGEGREGGET